MILSHKVRTFGQPWWPGVGATSFVTWSLLLFSQLTMLPVSAILQTAELDVYLSSNNNRNDQKQQQQQQQQAAYTLLVSQASFGSYPSMRKTDNPVLTIVTPPSDNPLLCNNLTTSNPTPIFDKNTIVFTPRGLCTFETKAWHAQQLGAAAILIYGTLTSRYSFNETTKKIIYPKQFNDYDCSKGSAYIDEAVLSFDPAYNGQVNDPLLSGANHQENLCWKASPDHLKNCESKACLLTGNKSSTSLYEACCAWDFHIWLYADQAFTETNKSQSKQEELDRLVTIPAAYLTLQQGNRILNDLHDNSQMVTNVQVVLSSRYRQVNWNPSSFLIWALGVCVAAIAAHASSIDYRSAAAKVLVARERVRDAQRQPSLSSVSSRSPSAPVLSQSSSFSEELTAEHALGFIIMSSTSLLVLFYFKIYAVVKVLYAMGCSKAVSQVVMSPTFEWIMQQLNISSKRIVWRTNTEDFGDITVLDVVSHVAGYAMGITWLVLGFTVRHAESLTFFWVVQDLFGTAMCIMFLQVIKLNSIRVATILLLVAFFYDIFFVFITPLLFHGKSVMITVATSGGPPTADPAWCEKYPDDRDCQGGEPLPMLLTVPRINDYMGGSSLLGLGDIVLPGLLLSFAARFDAAKSLLGIMGGGHGSLNSYNCPERKFCFDCRFCSAGYFLPLVVAYAVGLFMANAAVYLMNTGQPALLYLVPCCLGTVGFMGWRRGELKDLWDGPRCIRSADDIVYGESNSNDAAVSANGDHHHRILPTDDDNNHHATSLSIPSVPSAEDGDGDLPLLEGDESRRKS